MNRSTVEINAVEYPKNCIKMSFTQVVLINTVEFNWAEFIL